ncbi:hypothetical protein MASR1M90_17970 [Desulfovibrionales bacterium]
MASESLLLLGADSAWQFQVQALAPELGYTATAPQTDWNTAQSLFATGPWTMFLVEHHIWAHSTAMREAVEQADLPVVCVVHENEALPEDQCVLSTPLTLLSLAVAVEKARHTHTLTMKLRKAHQETAAAQAAYNSRFAHSPLGLYRSTVDGRFISINPAMAAMLGHDSPQDALDTYGDLAIQLFLHPEDRERFLAQLLRYGTIRQFEYQARTKTGALIWLAEDAWLITDEQGREVIDGFVRNITARKVAEEQVAKNTERLRTVVSLLQRSYHSAQELLDAALDEAVNLTESSYGFIACYDEEHQKFQINAWSCNVMPECQIAETRFSYDLSTTGLWGETIRQRREIIINDFTAPNPWKKGCPKGHVPVHRFMSVPIFSDAKIVAVIGLANKKTDYTPTDVLQAQLLMDSVWKTVAQKHDRQNFEHLFMSMTSGFALHEIITDANGQPKDYTFLSVNPAFETLTGLRSADILGRTVLDVLPDTESYWIEHYGQVALTGAPIRFEQYSKALGRYFIVTAYCPRPGQFATIFEDISAHKESTARLHNRERRIRALLNATADAVFLLDNNGIILDLNEHAAKRRNCPPQDLIGMSILDTLPADIALRRKAALETCMRLKGMVLHEEERNGMFYSIRLFPIFDDHDMVCQVASFSRDVTERTLAHTRLLIANQELLAATKRAQELAVQSEAASRAKSEFLANMSHEIRTPLNGILGMLQLLQMTALSAEQDEYVGLAMKSSTRLTSLLSDILDLSRIESGRMVVQEIEFAAHSLRDGVLELFSVAAQDKATTLSVIMSPDLPASLIGDETRIQQIIFNLVGNAIKFTSQGQVELSISLVPGTKAHPCQMLILVTDTGVGIPDDRLKDIFNPFVQGEGSYVRTYQGAGLGLAIVRRLVLLLGGTLATSSEPQAGTCIAVALPLRLPEHQEHSGDSMTTAHTPQTPATPRLVLFAEDDEVNQLTGSILLKKLGLEVMTASNGEEAVRVLHEHPVDVVLMDIQMPVMDGVAATRAIRTSETLGQRAQVPIIAMTAYAMNGDREKFLEAGMNGYLSKPVHIDDLRQAIHCVMQK